MKLEDGKSYRNKMGAKVGPMQLLDTNRSHRWRAPNGTTYADDGSYLIFGESKWDLVEPCSEEPQPPAVISQVMYGTLAGVLQAAHDQAVEQGGDDAPFLEQPIMEIARLLGSETGHAYRIIHKTQEANRLARCGQYNEAAGAYFAVINYAAAAVLHLREVDIDRTPL